MTNTTLRVKPDAGNPYVTTSQCHGGVGRFDEGEGAPCTEESLFRRVGVCFALFGFAVAFSAFAAERQWTGGGGDNLWQTAANWSDSTVPTGTDAAVFDIGDGNALQVLDSAAVTYPETIKVASGTVCLGSTGRYCNFSTLTGIVEVAQEACLIVSNRIEKKDQAIVKKGGGDVRFHKQVCLDGSGRGCKFLDIQGGTVAFESSNGYLKMHTDLDSGIIRIHENAVFDVRGYNRLSGDPKVVVDEGGTFLSGSSDGLNAIKSLAGGGTVGVSPGSSKTHVKLSYNDAAIKTVFYGTVSNNVSITLPNTAVGSFVLSNATALASCSTVTAGSALKFAPGIGSFKIKAFTSVDGCPVTLEDEDGAPVELILQDKPTLGAGPVFTGSGNLCLVANNSIVTGNQVQVTGVFSVSNSSDSSIYLGNYSASADADLSTPSAIASWSKAKLVYRNAANLVQAASLLGNSRVDIGVDGRTTGSVTFEDVRKTGGAFYAYAPLVLNGGESTLNYTGFSLGSSGSLVINGGTFGCTVVDASSSNYRSVPKVHGGLIFSSTPGSVVTQNGGLLYHGGTYNAAAMRYNLRGGILAPTAPIQPSSSATTENPSVYVLDGGLFAPSLNNTINEVFKTGNDTAGKACAGRIVLKVGGGGARFGSINQEYSANPNVPFNLPLAAENEGEDGGVTFEDRASYTFSYPFSLSGDVRVRDGGVALANAADTATTPRFFGAGSFSLRNAALTYQQCASDKNLQLASAAGKGLSYEGGSMIRFRRANGGSSGNDYANNADNFSKQTLVSGPISRVGKGSVLYLWDGVNQYVGADGASKYTVSGGVANGASGAVSQPIVGIKNYDQTFLKYDSVGGFMEFDAYATISGSTTSDSIVDVSSASTVSADKSIGGLRMIQTSQGVTVAAGKTLTVGNGTDPALVLMRRNTLGGAGTVNFGGSEGVISVGPQDDATHRATVSVKLAGSGGVSYVSAPDTDMYYRRVYVSGANTYTGGTRVNSVRVQVANESAFGVGDVYVGGGRFAGGRVAFDTAITVANDFHIAGTGIRNTMWNGFENQGALEFNADATLTGDVELVEPARITMPTANVTATISGTVSGDALEVLRVATSTLVLSGHNTYTGGTEVVSAKLALAHGDGAGTGKVRLDNGVLRFENTAAETFANDMDGVGTVELAGGAAVDFTGDVSFLSATCAICAMTQEFNSLPPFATIENASGGVVTLRIAGGQGTIAWEGRELAGGEFKLFIGEGTLLDLGGGSLTIRTALDGSDSRIVNGTLVQTRPQQGMVFIIK